MNYPYFKVSATEDVKEKFNKCFEVNKSVFQTKANMFRYVVSNLPMLTKANQNFRDPEKEELAKNLEEAKLKISELETIIELQKQQLENFNKKEDSTNKDYSKQLNSIEESVYKLLINSGLASKELEEERAEPEKESSRLGDGTMFSSPSLRFTTD